MNHVRDSLAELIKSAGEDFVKDLQSLTYDDLNTSVGGSARKATDFSYEVAAVNRRIASRLKGEDPGPWPFEGWVVAPEDCRSQEALIAEINGSIALVLEALAGLTDEELFAPLQVGGQDSSLYKLASMCLIHTCYHDGQLNYIQSFKGDMEVHWS